MTDDKQAVAEVAAVSDADAPHSIIHYLYLPNRDDAASVARELRTGGFDTEERLGADCVNWLVLARHVAVPTEALMTATRRLTETLVAKLDGEYDGWEADVRLHHDGSGSRH